MKIVIEQVSEEQVVRYRGNYWQVTQRPEHREANLTRLVRAFKTGKRVVRVTVKYGTTVEA